MKWPIVLFLFHICPLYPLLISQLRSLVLAIQNWYSHWMCPPTPHCSCSLVCIEYLLSLNCLRRSWGYHLSILFSMKHSLAFPRWALMSQCCVLLLLVVGSVPYFNRIHEPWKLEVTYIFLLLFFSLCNKICKKRNKKERKKRYSENSAWLE